MIISLLGPITKTVKRRVCDSPSLVMTFYRLRNDILLSSSFQTTLINVVIERKSHNDVDITSPHVLYGRTGYFLFLFFFVILLLPFTFYISYFSSEKALFLQMVFHWLIAICSSNHGLIAETTSYRRVPWESFPDEIIFVGSPKSHYVGGLFANTETLETLKPEFP